MYKYDLRIWQTECGIYMSKYRFLFKRWPPRRAKPLFPLLYPPSSFHSIPSILSYNNRRFQQNHTAGLWRCSQVGLITCALFSHYQIRNSITHGPNVVSTHSLIWCSGTRENNLETISVSSLPRTVFFKLPRPGIIWPNVWLLRWWQGQVKGTVEPFHSNIPWVN